MKKLLFFAVAMCLAACSSDPTSYTLIEVLKDGSQQKEKFNAENDSAAAERAIEIAKRDKDKAVDGTLLNYKGDTVDVRSFASEKKKKEFEEISNELDSLTNELDGLVNEMEKLQ